MYSNINVPGDNLMFLRILMLIYFTATVVACSSTTTQPEEDLTPPETKVSASPTYKIGPGDVISISVWKNEELSVEVPVRPDGYLSVPLVGDVLASGKRPEEVGKEIELKLTQYVRSPKVSVIVSQLVSHEFLSRVRVVGAVSEPKSISYRKGMTILDLVLEAGGVNEFAEPDRANLYRKTKTGVKTYPVFLEQILQKGRLESNFSLEPGDVISIPERRF